jgi:predicted O-methyltransferase YrrM
MLDDIIKVIQESEKNAFLKGTNDVELAGFSGTKLLGTLQGLVELFSTQGNTCYLEIGVFQGLTLCLSSLACPNFTCYGIDNFAFFDPGKKNMSIVQERIQKLQLNNTHLINQDYEEALENLRTYIEEKKIGVYFIDGPHDYRSQLMCLQLALPYLHEQAVIIVDDSNYRHVRQANRDFLVTHPEYKLIFEAYTPCHPQNMTSEQEQQARKGWWNGVNIIVRDPEQKLSPMYPPTERSRELYENEHIIHSSKFAELAPNTIELIIKLEHWNLFGFFKQLGLIKYRLIKNDNYNRAKYYHLNTYSDILPEQRYNDLK